MLKELYIDNYRRFLNANIVFNKTVLIAGKNGTGKTTVVEVLDKIKRFIVNADSTGHVQGLVSIADLPRWLKTDYGDVKTQFTLKWEASSEETYNYELEIQHNLHDKKCRITGEKLRTGEGVVYDFILDKEADAQAVVFTDDHKKYEYYVDWNHSGLLLAGRVNSKIRKFIAEIQDKLHVFILAPESHILVSASDGLDMSGNNFSRWYSAMLAQDIEVAAEVLSSYRDFLPNVERTFINDKTREFTVSEKAEGKQKFEIAFSELSTGQKKLCVYYALFKMLPDGATIVFDEFENHLSPAELQPLYDLAQHEQDERDLQIILVSHHHRTLNWYHDSALVFSLSGMPAHNKIDTFNPDECGTTLEKYIEAGGK